MAVGKYKSSDGTYKTLLGINVKNEVVQTTGSSTTAVMSQKAVSDLVPAQASPSNQLADKNFVNSSIATATATYRGCYNLVSDLSLTTQASHGQIEQALATKMTALSITPDNNDYAFVQIPTADATPTEIASVERYKFNGTYWSFEYTINNSGFTAAQWAAVNSSITSGLVDKLNTLFSNTQSTVAKVLGIDANGGPQNIGISDLASVLGVKTSMVKVGNTSNALRIARKTGSAYRINLLTGDKLNNGGLYIFDGNSTVSANYIYASVYSDGGNLIRVFYDSNYIYVCHEWGSSGSKAVLERLNIESTGAVTESINIQSLSITEVSITLSSGIPTFYRNYDSLSSLSTALGVINSDNIKIKTRLEADTIWSGYWDAVLTIESSSSGIGVAGFELAVIIGDLPKMAIRNKVNGGAWSSWKIWS